MEISLDFLKKNRLAVTHLARDLLITEVGERIVPMDSYAENLGVSRGTVQKAMQFLEDYQCIATTFRGHMGSYLSAKNDAKLWEYSGFGTLSGSMTLPLNRLPSGLATGICDCMRAKSFAYNCVFMQGSHTRLKGLNQGRYDFIVASRLTEKVFFEEAGQSELFGNIENVKELPGCLYSGRYALLFKDPACTQVEDGMTVSVDPTSVDQYYITQQVCAKKKNIHFKELTYLDTHYSVKRGEADMTVSRMDAIVRDTAFTGMNAQRISLPQYSNEEIDNWGSAVVLARKDNYGLADLLRKTLRPAMIAKAQQMVVSGERPSNYF